MRDGNFAFDALLIPAYCAGGLSVGTFVNRLTWHDPRSSHYSAVMSCRASENEGALRDSPSSPSDGSKTARPYAYSIGRYVQSESSGEMLILKHTERSYQSGLPATEIMYLQNGSSTRRIRSYFQCGARPYNPDDVLNAVQSCITYEESRFCPVCRSSPNESCSCQLPLVRTNHIFDFISAARCIETHTGEFMGTAEVIARDVCLSVDPHQSQQLDDVIYPMSTDSPSPSPQLSPDYVCATCLSSVRNISLTRQDRSVAHESLATILSNIAVQISVSSGNPAKFVLPLGTDVSVTDGVNASRPVGCERKSVSSAALSSAQHQEHVETLDANSPQNSTAVPSVWKKSWNGIITYATRESVVESPQDNVQGNVYDFEDVMQSSDRTKCCNSSAVGIHRKAFTGTGSEAKHDQNSRGACDTFEDARISNSALARKSVSSDVSSDTRAARECQRMLKNRASAARANARKKAFMDELKQSIKNAKDRAAALNARQLELVRENMQLRRRLLGQ